jgi:osmoprotectant transport system substrate-binding protein
MGRRRTIGILVLAAIIGGAGCSSDPGDRADSAAVDVASTLRDDTVTVGSFDFTESELVAEIYSQALEGEGYDVERAFGLGPREFVLPALAGGLIEVVPEYAGSALQFSSLAPDVGTADVSSTNDQLAGLLAERGVTVLAPSPAQDANTFVVTRETAQREHLRTLSDLAAVAPEMTFAGPPECPSRPFCLLGLERVYGLSFREVLALDAGGPLTHQAIASRDVDVALSFTTDPALIDGSLVELEDDRDLQPAENVTPLVRSDVIDHFGPVLVARMDTISQRLTTDGLRALNAELAAGDQDIAAVASAWLAAEGLS